MGESGMADSSLGGMEEGVWPPSDPSITEEIVEEGCNTKLCFINHLRELWSLHRAGGSG